MIAWLLKQIAWLLKQLISVLWRGLPHALRLVLSVGGLTIKTAALSIVSAYVGLPESVRRTADEWTARAIRANFPSIWENQLRFCFEVLASYTIFSGWAIVVFTIATLFNLIF
jgi:hypothetical protein